MKKIAFLCVAIAAVFAVTSCNDGSNSTVAQKDSMTSVVSSDTGGASSTEHNRKIIMASMDAINRHDADAMLKDAAPDMVEYGDGNSEPMRNADSLKMMLKSWLVAFPDFKAENIVYAADGNTVMVASDCSGTWKNDFIGMKATNKSFKVKDVDIFNLNVRGKIASHRSIQNMEPVYASLGMKMPGALKPNDINPTPHSEKIMKPKDIDPTRHSEKKK